MFFFSPRFVCKNHDLLSRKVGNAKSPAHLIFRLLLSHKYELIYRRNLKPDLRPRQNEPSEKKNSLSPFTSFPVLWRKRAIIFYPSNILCASGFRSLKSINLGIQNTFLAAKVVLLDCTRFRAKGPDKSHLRANAIFL